MPHVVDPTLTEPWCRVYEALRQAWEEFGVAPSKLELRQATGYSSTTINNAYRELKRAGHITSSKFTARSGKPVDITRTISSSEALAPQPWDEVSTERMWSGITR